MKKILSILLVFVMAVSCVFALASCGDNDPGEPPKLPGNEPETPKTVYEIIEDSNPTKVTSEISYVTAAGVSMNARYELLVSGEDYIFHYKYKRYNNPTTDGQNGLPPISDVDGYVYCKDGQYSTDGVSYTDTKPGVTPPTLALVESNLVNPEILNDGKTLLATLLPEEAEVIFGTDFNAKDIIVLLANTEGTYLRSMILMYTAESGAVVEINNTYSYSAITLEFPDGD